jgi:hypothetical protein
MTFETHTDTILATREELPDDIEIEWIPSWEADKYINSECKAIIDNYTTSSPGSARYAWLYKLIKIGAISAYKRDGFWFYSKTSIKRFNESDGAHAGIVNSDVWRWHSQNKKLDQKRNELERREDEVTNEMDALLDELFKIGKEKGELQESEAPAYTFSDGEFSALEKDVDAFNVCDDSKAAIQKCWAERYPYMEDFLALVSCIRSEPKPEAIMGIRLNQGDRLTLVERNPT